MTSEPTKTERMTKKLETLEDVEEMKKVGRAYAEEIGCATSLVYKVIKKIMKKRPEDQKALPESKEPVVKIEKAEEVEIPEPEEEIEEEEEAELPEEIPPEEEELEEVEEEEEKELPEITPQMVKTIFALPYRIAARVTKCEDVELTEQEQNDIADACHPLIAAYAPEAVQRHFPVIYAIYVVGNITVGKAMIYREWKAEQEETEEPEAPAQPETPQEETPETPTPEQIETKKKTVPAALKKM